MYIMTAHRTVVGVEGTSNLVQIDREVPGYSSFVQIPDAGDDKTFDSGPLSGFRILTQETGVSFMKGDNFLCAEPGGRYLVANRKIAAGWETFRLIPEESLKTFLNYFKSTSDEIARFNERVVGLVADNRPVKLYCGCGTVPRPGFLNLDIAVFNIDFAIENADDYFIFPFADMSWEIPDDSVDYIFHEDFIEHITQLQQIQFLAEAWRVLKPGCYHRVNTPNIIAAMKRYSNFRDGFKGVYTGELKWGHISIFSPLSLKEIAELVGYKEVVFTTKHHGVSPFAETDLRPAPDRDDVGGNIYADLKK